jgi:hypothetical protein
MYRTKPTIIGALALAAMNVYAEQERVVFGPPQFHPQVLTQSTAMTCNGKTLIFERVTRASEDGTVRRQASLSLEGVPLQGEKVDMLTRSLDKPISLMASYVKCSTRYRNSPETFMLTVTYQWWGDRESERVSSRVMCGQANIWVDPKNPEAVEVSIDERRLGSRVTKQEKPAHLVCW